MVAGISLSVLNTTLLLSFVSWAAQHLTVAITDLVLKTPILKRCCFKMNLQCQLKIHILAAQGASELWMVRISCLRLLDLQ